MTNFEKITKNESALVDWLRGVIFCDKCPVLKKCSCADNDKPCQRLIYEWLKREDGEEPEPDVFTW
jgi:hypothetical protein